MQKIIKTNKINMICLLELMAYVADNVWEKKKYHQKEFVSVRN